MIVTGSKFKVKVENIESHIVNVVPCISTGVKQREVVPKSKLSSLQLNVGDELEFTVLQYGEQVSVVSFGGQDFDLDNNFILACITSKEEPVTKEETVVEVKQNMSDWELAGYIYHMSTEAIREIFDCDEPREVFMRYTDKEARERYETYSAQVFKFGEIITVNNNNTFAVLQVNDGIVTAIHIKDNPSLVHLDVNCIRGKFKRKGTTLDLSRY